MLPAARVNLILTFGSVQAKQTNCRENELNATGRKKKSSPNLVCCPKTIKLKIPFHFFLCSVILASQSEGLQAVRRMVQRLGPRKARDKSRTSNNHHASFGGLLIFLLTRLFFLVRCQVYCSRATPLLLEGKTSHPLPITNRPIVVGASGKFNDGFLFCFSPLPFRVQFWLVFRTCGVVSGEKAIKFTKCYSSIMRGTFGSNWPAFLMVISVLSEERGAKLLRTRQGENSYLSLLRVLFLPKLEARFCFIYRLGSSRYQFHKFIKISLKALRWSYFAWVRYSYHF